ncbi:zinc ribbon domain-containing protein [Methanoregula sp.]|uniref:zinc ribbon domain-containing protein n=2 Tax=Methanoregula sp. TaxID=2052170 RepID=UPI003BB04430
MLQEKHPVHKTAVFIPLPFLSTREEYMTKKCGNCGAPAPDSNSRFCDLCGAPLKEEPVSPQGLPVCPACGAIVSDRKAQFCDLCGAQLAKPVCPVCGNPAPSSHSKFCTRCGATFVPAAPGKTRAATPAAPGAAPEPEPVVVKLRKGRLPVPDDPAGEWDPWSDGDPAYDISAPLPHQQPQKPNTDLQRIAEETAQSPGAAPVREPQVAGPRKKYSHLPLVADELKADIERRAAHGDAESGGPGWKGKKKGLFGFK